MIGRGLRPINQEEHPGLIKKDCVVLDFGTSVLTHGSLDEGVDLRWCSSEHWWCNTT
jgi:DNA repair protein RadD